MFRMVKRANLVASKNIFGESLLAKAFDSIGSKELLEAVLEFAWDVIPHSSQVLWFLP